MAPERHAHDRHSFLLVVLVGVACALVLLFALLVPQTKAGKNGMARMRRVVRRKDVIKDGLNVVTVVSV